MANTAEQTNEAPAAAQAGESKSADVNIRIIRTRRSLDMTTVVALVGVMGLIATAILIGGTDANFFNIPSVLIVILGTIFATAISYSWSEIANVGKILGQCFFKKSYKPALMATQLMDLAMVARKKGLLALSSIEKELRRDPHLAKAVQIVTDGYGGDDVARVLMQDLDALVERHRRAASILRRGSEVAPAMGLIGTLVGLVQMLAQLQDPESIGPSMAVALLTTFYGAILGTVVLGPLAAKLERNSNEESMIRSLVVHAMVAIANQENPRRLEMILNSELPPSERIRYFD